MKSKKVVRIEINTAECGNTVVEVIFGVRGRTMEFGSNAGGGVYMRSVWKFTETNRIILGWHEGYNFRHFDNWEIPVPKFTDKDDIITTLVDAFEDVAGFHEIPYSNFQYDDFLNEGHISRASGRKAIIGGA